MRIALADVGLTSLTVVHAGRATYPMSVKACAVALWDVGTEVNPLR